MHENTEVHEKLILIGVETGSSSEMTRSLDELSDLVSTAGAETVGRIIQNRERIHPGTYIGKGKIEEVKDLLWETEATGVVCDDELSPAQMKNLEDALDTKVLDRTVLILDIFASRAVTKEGRIQVELAQSRYALTRLQGFGRSMSRLGGGIGTRGPGETKLETDRRRIRARISQLKTELEEVERKRALAGTGLVLLVGHRPPRFGQSPPSDSSTGWTAALFEPLRFDSRRGRGSSCRPKGRLRALTKVHRTFVRFEPLLCRVCKK